MEFDNPIQFKSPIQRIRDTIGMIVFIIALIIFLSGVGMMIFGSHVYGDPIQGYPKSYDLSVSSGSQIQVNITDLKAGNDYDIRISFKILSSATNQPTSEINLGVSGNSNTLDYSYNDKLIENGFNSTIERQVTQEFPVKLTVDSEVSYLFTVDNAKDIKSITIEISVYQNPNRSLFKLISTVGIITIFVGILLMVLGGVIAGKQKKSRSGMLSQSNQQESRINFKDQFKF